MSLPCGDMGAQKGRKETGFFSLAFGIVGLPLGVGGPHDGLLAQW